MQPKSITSWHKALWKFVTNPTVEVMAAIAVVMVALWVVVQADVDLKHSHRPFPVAPFVHK